MVIVITQLHTTFMVLLAIVPFFMIPVFADVEVEGVSGFYGHDDAYNVIGERQSQENTISLATVAGPLMAAGVIVTSLFFVNAVHNKRESDLFYSKTDHSKST